MLTVFFALKDAITAVKVLKNPKPAKPPAGWLA
jgi:hypothetical protein